LAQGLKRTSKDHAGCENYTDEEKLERKTEMMAYIQKC